MTYYLPERKMEKGEAERRHFVYRMGTRFNVTLTNAQMTAMRDVVCHIRRKLGRNSSPWIDFRKTVRQNDAARAWWLLDESNRLQWFFIALRGARQPMIVLYDQNRSEFVTALPQEDPRYQSWIPEEMKQSARAFLEMMA